MNRRRLTLIEVLQPQCFSATPERARVTRTILQPEIDAFELMEAQAAGAEKSAPAGRRAASAGNTSIASSQTASNQPTKKAALSPQLASA